MDFSKSSTRKLQSLIMDIRRRYNVYVGTVPQSYEEELRKEAEPLLEEMNKRLKRIWEDAGIMKTGEEPKRLSFDRFIKQGLYD